MWSTKLIIGVAVGASFVMTFTGIILAITIERRRYRKYVRRHIAGTTDNNQHELGQAIDDCTCKTLAQMSPQICALRNSSETWMTLPQPDHTDYNVRSEVYSPTSEQKPATKKNLHKTLNGPIRKKKGGRRRLKRVPPHGRVMISPLPAIAEHSDGSQVSFEPPIDLGEQHVTEKPQKSESDSSGQSPLSDSITANPLPSRTKQASLGDITTSGRPELLPKSLSIANSISSVPEESLPSLPMTQENKYRLRQRASIASIDSVSSSVLDPYSPSIRKPTRKNEKTCSRALQEFDFDLPSTQRRCSPLHQTVSMQDSQVEERYSTKGTNPNNTVESGIRHLFDTKISGCIDDAEQLSKQMEDLMIGPTGRHSMYDNAEVLRGWRKSNPLGIRHEQNDPFISDLPMRPFSLGERIPLRELEPKTRAKLLMWHHLEFEDTRLRNNNTRSSQWPVLAPVARAHMKRLSPDPEKISLVQATAERNMAQFITEFTASRLSTRSPGPRNIDSRGNSRTMELPWSGHDGSRCPSPNTPLSGTIQKWRFDFLPPDTPTLFPPPSPERSHNSPVLPSPAYSPRELYLRPRHSQIRGPRSPPGSRNQSRSPLRQHPPALHRVKSTSVFSVERNESPMELRKSVMLLRSLNSEGRLLSSEQDLAYHRLGSVGRELPVTFKHIPSKHNLAVTSSATTPAIPTITGKTSMASLQSSESTSGVSSIWEDASVQEDFPEPESRVLTPIQATERPVFDILQVSKYNAQNRTEEIEAHENLVRNCETLCHSKQAELERR